MSYITTKQNTDPLVTYKNETLSKSVAKV